MGSYRRVCEICGARSFKGTYDGEWMYDTSEGSININQSKLALLRKRKNMC